MSVTPLNSKLDPNLLRRAFGAFPSGVVAVAAGSAMVLALVPKVSVNAPAVGASNSKLPLMTTLFPTVWLAPL